LSRLVGYLIAAVVWLGFAMVFVRKRGSAFMLFGAIYLAATVLWVSSGYRLFYPIMPQLYLAFLLGLDTLLRGAGAAAARTAPSLAATRSPLLIACASLLVLLSIYQSIRLPNTRNHIGSIAARTSWLAQNTAADDVIMTEQPVVDFVYSERRTLWYPTTCPDAGELAAYLDSRGVDYVLVAPPRHWQAHFEPTYSDRAQCVLTALDALSSENRVELVHASEVDNVRVFRHSDE
jgi:hypothetical protein